MRTKVTLVLLFLNAALFLFIFRFERNWRTERVALAVQRRVLGAEAADIRALEVTRQGGGSFRIERRGDVWFLTSPLEWPANPAAVSRIVSDLQFLDNVISFSVSEVLKNNQTLAAYGLDHPRLTVTITSGGPETTGAAPITTTLRIGDSTNNGQRLYLLSPDGARIHVVGRELADGLSLPIELLRADTVLEIPVFEARTLSLQASPPSGVRVLIQQDGSRWLFESPIPAQADKDAIELAINNLDALRVKGFVESNPPVPAPKDAPTLIATIEGDRRQETLFLGQPVPGSPSGGETRELYAQLEGRSAIFTVDVPEKLLETLRDAQESLRDRQILDFDPTQVTVITLHAPNTPDLILQRLESNAPEPSWLIVQRSDDGRGPATLPADSQAVGRLLDRLQTLSAKEFKSDAPQKSELENWGFTYPERRITLRSSPAGAAQAAPAPGSDLTLEIGHVPGDPSVYARLTTSQSIYTVDPDILQDTPVSPLDWRARDLPALPESAVITELKLTDMADNKVVAEWASGSPPDPSTARAKAIGVLLDEVRAPRARRFVSDAFGDSVSAGGEVLPWRYALEATVALPGGAGGGKTDGRQLKLTERAGGTTQYAGSPEFGAIFEIDQRFVDALWTLTYGARDPGEPPPPAAHR